MTVGADRAALVEAAKRYVAAFEAFSDNGARTAPAWLKERRAQGIATFADQGFPSTRDEGWRFTDVKRLAEQAFTLASGGPAADVSAARQRYVVGDGAGGVAVFVNGSFAPEHSSLEALPDGVRVGSLSEALARTPELLEPHLAMLAGPAVSPFAALSTAFIRDGAFVHVAAGAAAAHPLQLLFLTTSDGEATVSHPRNLMWVERGGQASVIETYASLGDGMHWTNAVTEVIVGANARLETYRLQDEHSGAFHTAVTHSKQDRDSRYACTALVFGAALARHDLVAELDGEGAEATLYGLSLLRGRQHVDHHTTLVHAQPHCNSWEFFNGVFAERARGVFNGRIVVKPGAQKTDAKQTNNNLLLSERARADSQPQLEIYADDVKCTHGATLGPIDERQLFYLQSRGLSLAEARRLLTYGFAGEIIDAIGWEDLQSAVEGLVNRRLAEPAFGGD